MNDIGDNYKVHVMDFEGTVQAGILEYGIVSIGKGNKLLEVYTRLCSPRNMQVAHKLCQRMCWDVSLFEQTSPVQDDWELFSALRQTGCFAAHHAIVESRMLESVWALPQESPDFINPGKAALSWGPWIDTCVLAKHFVPGCERYQLESLVQAFGLQPQLDDLAASYCPKNRRRYHCALYDTLASALLLMLIWENNPSLTLFELVKYSERSASLQDGRSQLSLFE